jgi:hypothetical protein
VKRLIAGLVLGVVATLAVQRGLRYTRSHQHSEPDAVVAWAYRHVPDVVGSSPGSVRTLDVTTGSVASTPSERERGEKMFKVRLVYEADRQIKVVNTVCRFVDGKLVSPSDSELRALDAAAQPLPVPQ